MDIKCNAIRIEKAGNNRGDEDSAHSQSICPRPIVSPCYDVPEISRQGQRRSGAGPSIAHQLLAPIEVNLDVLADPHRQARPNVEPAEVRLRSAPHAEPSREDKDDEWRKRRPRNGEHEPRLTGTRIVRSSDASDPHRLSKSLTRERLPCVCDGLAQLERPVVACLAHEFDGSLLRGVDFFVRRVRSRHRVGLCEA